MKPHHFFFTLAMALFVGCGTNPARYYKSFNRTDVIFQHNMKPQVIWSDNAPDVDYNDALANNYDAIGEASFRSSRGPTKSQIVTLAKRQGASIACAYSKYVGSDVVYAPLAVPTCNTTTTSHSGGANTYISGSGFGGGSYTSYSGTANTMYSGTSTSYSYGTQITSIPVTRHFYDYYIVLYAPLKEKMRFGVSYDDISEATATKIGTRQGVFVMKVVRGLPFYNADILEGDIITEIDGEKTRNKQDFNTTLHSLPTQGSIVLTILRNGEKIKKEVKF